MGGSLTKTIPPMCEGFTGFPLWVLGHTKLADPEAVSRAYVFRIVACQQVRGPKVLTPISQSNVGKT